MPWGGMGENHFGRTVPADLHILTARGLLVVLNPLGLRRVLWCKKLSEEPRSPDSRIHTKRPGDLFLAGETSSPQAAFWEKIDELPPANASPIENRWGPSTF